MRRVLLVVAVAAVAALAAAGPGGAAGGPDYCCVNAGLKASYDATAKRISAHWQALPVGITPVEVRAGDRLGADGIVDSSSPRLVRVHGQGTGGSFGAGKLALVLDTHGGVFVQVRFQCATATALVKVCTTGFFWSHPVQITAEATPQTGTTGSGATGGTTSPLGVVSTHVTLKSNGTQACKDAWAKLSTVIDKITANTAAAKKAHEAGKSTAAFAKRQATLSEIFDTDYAAAKTACAKKK